MRMGTELTGIATDEEEAVSEVGGKNDLLLIISKKVSIEISAFVVHSEKTWLVASFW